MFSLAFGSIFLVAHSFSHKFSSQIEIIKNDVSQSTKSYSQFAFFSAQKLFNHGKSSHDLSHCSWCFVVSIYNQIAFASLIFLVFAAFHLSFLARDFNRVKLAYINSSSLSRAPPLVS